MKLTITVNGERREADGVWEGESLLNALRDDLDLPGSKNACEQGECGSCSVLPRRHARVRLPRARRPGRGPRRDHGRGHRRRREPARRPAGDGRRRRRPVRLLHAGLRRRLARPAASAIRARPSPRSARRSPATSAAARATRRSSTRSSSPPAGWPHDRADHHPPRATSSVPGRVGENSQRIDGVPKVRGEFEYSSDMRVEGMLWGATLRSPHPRADIRSIDIGAGARAARASTPCSPTRTCRAARPTGWRSPTSPCWPGRRSATRARRSRSSPPTIRRPPGAPSRRSRSNTRSCRR